MNNAFLKGELFEEVYIDIFQGYKTKINRFVCKLNKPIYGLRQAFRQLFYKFSSTLLQHGFTMSKKDYSVIIYCYGPS